MVKVSICSGMSCSMYGSKDTMMALQKEQDLDDGYIGVPTDVARFLGKQGKALTVLRPAGKIEVEGTMLDAVSVHDFIDAGEPIVVTKYENTQLYVQRSK